MFNIFKRKPKVLNTCSCCNAQSGRFFCNDNNRFKRMLCSICLEEIGKKNLEMMLAEMALQKEAREKQVKDYILTMREEKASGLN